jgi:hypothetical protein|tara:strand:+ start:9643 stop:9990 length:348 start_codon:yes stop_codon:yes gene_type:complete
MAGTLDSNLVKDIYQQLIFRKADGKFYRDNGNTDVELLNPSTIEHSLTADNKLSFTASPDLTSGRIFELKNGNNEVFAVDYQGAMHLEELSSAPADNSAGTIYFNGTNLIVAVDE